MAYFPAALAGVARWSKLGNDKHNPGEPMHHARGKSNDHMDCIPRHLLDLGDVLAAVERADAANARVPDLDIVVLLDEVDALAWRALALSQELHERFGGAPLAPGARLPAVVASPPGKAENTITIDVDTAGIAAKLAAVQDKLQAVNKDWELSQRRIRARRKAARRRK
jgi:hypothetical protein